MGSRQEWHKIMRQTIKLENGDGWSVRGREIRGMNKTQVTYRFQDGLGMKNPRSAFFLPYAWTAETKARLSPHTSQAWSLRFSFKAIGSPN